MNHSLFMSVVYNFEYSIPWPQTAPVVLVEGQLTSLHDGFSMNGMVIRSAGC